MPRAARVAWEPLNFPQLRDVGSPTVGGTLSPLNVNRLSPVDEAIDRFRERKRCCRSEEFLEFVAILPGQTLSQVFARISHATKGWLKDSDASVTTTEFLFPMIHQEETRCDPHPLRTDNR